MAAFLSGLGSGITSYLERVGMNSPAGQAVMQGIHRYRQGQQTTPTQAATPNTNPTGSVVGYPSQPSDESQMDQGGGMPMAAEGQLVTKPTVMLLGESGPEKVVPMNNNPENRVNSPTQNMANRYRGGI